MEQKLVMNRIFDIAKDKLFATGHVPMTYFISQEDGHIIAYTCDNPMGKDDFPVKEVKQLAEEHKAEYILFISESWAVEIQEHAYEGPMTEKYPGSNDWEADAMMLLKGMSPSVNPKRFECLTLICMNRQAKVQVITGKMGRKGKEAFVISQNHLPEGGRSEYHFGMIPEWEV